MSHSKFRLDGCLVAKGVVLIKNGGFGRQGKLLSSQGPPFCLMWPSSPDSMVTIFLALVVLYVVMMAFEMNICRQVVVTQFDRVDVSSGPMRPC